MISTLRSKRRFYGSVGVADDDGQFAVLLDERPARTPAGARLVLPTQALAVAVADEWASQDGDIRPLHMPLTRLAVTAIDRVSTNRAQVVAHVVAYGGTDVVCYRAEGPDELAAAQAEGWQPLLDWAAEALEARLKVTRGIVPVAQPEAALAALHCAVDALDVHHLTALADAVPAVGSLIIGLALLRNRLDADAAFELAHIDEMYQIARWGEDPITRDRHRRLRDDIRAAARFAHLSDMVTAG